MKFTPLEPLEKDTASVTLKGIALLAALDAGMIPRAKTADGYNIAPFLKFWEKFSPALEQACQK